MQRFRSLQVEAIVTLVFCAVLVLANYLLPSDEPIKAAPVAKRAKPAIQVQAPQPPSAVSFQSQTVEYRKLMVREPNLRQPETLQAKKQAPRKPQSLGALARAVKPQRQRVARARAVMKPVARNVAPNRNLRPISKVTASPARKARAIAVAPETEFERLVRKPDLDSFVKRDLNAELKQLQITRAQYQQLVVKRKRLAQSLKRDEVRSSPHLKRMLINDYRAWVREQLGENGYERYAEWSGRKF